MYDVLVYLFENYFQAEIYPDPDQLARKLSAVGFEEDDISDALNWLSTLQNAVPAQALEGGETRAIRLFDASEIAKLDVPSRGFLTFLESAGAVDARMREIIIERAMDLPEAKVSLPKFKVIALMVLWSQHALFDSLIIEELLSQGGQAEALH
jgi:Smg protein